MNAGEDLSEAFHSEIAEILHYAQDDVAYRTIFPGVQGRNQVTTAGAS